MKLYFDGKVCKVCKKPAELRVRTNTPPDGYMYYCRKCADECTMK